MKIGYFTYEYPIELPLGGIATYVQQAARLMAGRGHSVHVFTASREGGPPIDDGGATVHRVAELDPGRFPIAAGALFRTLHAQKPFDVVEGPDYGADAREAVRLVPDIPLVLKLHTPSILLLRLNYAEPGVLASLRAAYGSLRRRRWPRWGYRPEHEAVVRSSLAADRSERRHARAADVVSAPASSILSIMTREWRLDPDRSTVVPYPFVAPKALLDIPAGDLGSWVTFVGRLEVRKGVEEFARAIPMVLDAMPRARFRFVGATEPSPDPRLDMLAYLTALLRPVAHAVTFTGAVPPSAIPTILREAAVCVFPSRWENFPLVCLEAMAAARPVIGGREGGMADMLADGAGVLVDPSDPRAIARAILGQLRDPAGSARLGALARARVTAAYDGDRIAGLMERSYRDAIARRRALGPRDVTSSQRSDRNGTAPDPMT